MKRNIITLLFSLLTVIVCISQNTYPSILNDSLILITPKQIKQTNLIFAEHNKLKMENVEIKKQLELFDSIHYHIRTQYNIKRELLQQQYELTTKLQKDNEQQHKLISSLNRKNKIYKGIAIGGITVSVALLVILFIK